MLREGHRFLDAPCMDYWYCVTKWPHSLQNVGKYSLHGAFGIVEPHKSLSSQTLVLPRQEFFQDDLKVSICIH